METPYLLLYAIAAVAAFVWLLGLFMLLRVGRPERGFHDLLEDDLEPAQSPRQTTLRGSTVVQGEAGELAARAASQLAQHGLPAFGPVKILDQTEEQVVFETLGQMGARLMSRATLEFQPVRPGETQIHYSAQIPRRQGLLFLAWIVQALGLLALVAGFTALYLWVAPDPRPGVRWQTIQMIQVVHLLWPPFLFVFIYRRTKKHVRNTLDTLINNLPYVRG